LRGTVTYERDYRFVELKLNITQKAELRGISVLRRPKRPSQSRDIIMKKKPIPPLVSGFAITLLASITWQLLAVALLVRSTTHAFGALARLL
jgi:hypothetical protein